MPAGIVSIPTWTAFAALVAVGMLPGSAQPATAGQSLVPGGARTGLALRSRESVAAYLRAKGVQARAIVFQQGARNYAGPRCPGKTWNCTRAAVVVQTATAGGENSFVCSQASSGTSRPTACVIVQVAAGHSDNEARCVERSDAPGASQSCDITQTNTGGVNRATVDQRIDQGELAAQAGSQSASVKQSNGSGKNVVHGEQRIVEQAHDLSHGGEQSQQADQTIVVCQAGADASDHCSAPSAGDNTSEIVQSQTQTLNATAGGAITQSQNSNPGPSGNFHTVARIAQHSTAGRNVSDLDQSTTEDSKASSSSGFVSQTQGNSLGGIFGSVSQTSAGVSTASASQDERQHLDASAPPSAVSQAQIGPLYCCALQAGNPANGFALQQRSNQDAVVNGAGASARPRAAASVPTLQTDEISSDCTSSGVCDVTNVIVQNGGHSSLACTGPSCGFVNRCVNGVCSHDAVTPAAQPAPNRSSSRTRARLRG